MDKEVRVKKAMENLAKQGKMAPSIENTTKLAVIIGNSEYQANSGDSVSWDNLPGAKEDVVAMKTRLTDDGYQVDVTFPKVREGVFSINSQIVLPRTFLSKGFLGNNSFFKVNSPVNLKRVWFGPLKSFPLLADMI